MKKIASLIIAGMMVIGMTTPARAEENIDMLSTATEEISEEVNLDDVISEDDTEEIEESEETEVETEDKTIEKESFEEIESIEDEMEPEETVNEDDLIVEDEENEEESEIKFYSDEPIAYAVYCEGNTSLTFAYGDVPAVGDAYDNGYEVTAVYTGFEEKLATTSSGVSWSKVKSDITSVIFDDSFSCVQPTSPQYWFADCESLISVDFTGLDASQMKNMGYMFQNCSSLESLDLSGLNTESATSFYSFVENCTSLTYINLDGFDTSNATNFHTMFAGCTSLEEIDVSGFDVSNATMMYGMFQDCTAVQYLDFSNWNTENVQSVKYDTYFNHFMTGCPSIAQLKIGEDFDIFEKATQAQVDQQTWYDGAGECVSDNYLIGYDEHGDIYTEAIEPHVHTIVVDEAVEPTCRNTGLTEGSHCSECGEVIVEQETIPATGHNYKETVEKETTCMEDGIMRYSCEAGDASYTEVIPATGHTEVTDKAVSATCTSTGLTEGSHCSVCGEVITAQKTVAKTEHNYKTSTSGMVKTYTCKNCGATKTEYVDGLYKDSNGTWYYYTNGKKDTSYTGFASNSNGDWYVENGKVTKSKQGILKDTKGAIGSKGDWYYVMGSKVQADFTGLSNFSNENGWWYIKKGKVDFSAEGVYKNCNGWYYVSGGKVQFSYNGFASNSNGKWYVENGRVTKTKQGILKDTTGAIGSKGAWYYVIDSKVQTSFTGLSNFKNENGWWYIKKGQVDFSAHGVYKNCNGWYYVDGGKVRFNYTGFASNSNGKWYIENGRVTFKKQGILKDTTGEIGSKGAWYYVIGSKVQTSFTGLSNFSNENGWWYIKKGQVDFSANGVYKNCNGWYYVLNGKVQHGFTGLADYKNDNGWWYIKNGKVDFSAKGVYKNKNGWYYVENGKVDFSHNGVEKNSNGWWVIRNGRVDFNYTGLASNSNGVWYCKNGKVQFSANGSKTVDGVTYKCSGGKVTVSSSSLVTGGTSSQRSQINKYVAMVPANVIDRFAAGGGKIKIVDHFTFKGYENSTYAGMASGYYIELRSGASSISQTTTHEIGHFVDYYAAGAHGDNKYSNCTEFKNIMNSEISAYRNTFKNKYMDVDLEKASTTTTTEYFADAFSMYCRYPSDLKKNCPKTYAFVEKVVNMI